jgi:alpha-amylase
VNKRISLALIVHNHQPVGNFGWVIEDVFRKAYEPLVGALERHPSVRLALHYTGPLLEWIDANEPGFIERLQALVERDQVEILGGGMYEPILVSLPDSDRIGQLQTMRDDLERRFGRAPEGAWLAERVWEPSLPTALVDAGYEYTVLDDNHLRGAFVPEDQMWGTYTTDDQGRRLTIFGTEKGLRYRIPWKPVEDVIDYLRDNATDAGERVGIMGDDGEKFGAWPGTDELCWTKEMWVDRFFTALEENADWLSTVTPATWMREHAPIGRIYVPTASYVEMTEWALPAHEQNTFHELVAERTDEERAGKPRERSVVERESLRRFVRGGLWRNFQARYREINDMHKQMLRASVLVAVATDEGRRKAARDHLYRGQSNDCYWHGWFGGIYIVHMRMATLAELIAAEDIVLGDVALAGVADYDLDGFDEVLLGTSGQSLLVDVADGAGIGAWDLRPTRMALASVLRRRPEPYHARILEEKADLADQIVYDDHERRSGLVRVFGADDGAIGEFDRGPWAIGGVTDRGLVAGRVADGLTLQKTVALTGGRLDGTLRLTVDVSSVSDFDGTLELEWNLNLLGGGGNPAAYYRWADGETRHDAAGKVAEGVELSFGNEHEGVQLAVVSDPPAPQEWLPVETVSNSESGLERTYQGSCMIQRWPLRLVAGQTESFTTTFSVTQSRDRTADEL